MQAVGNRSDEAVENCRAFLNALKPPVRLCKDWALLNAT
ncbi:hypothetical protein GBP346_A2103 [Burkholderia pseudomallei MSHR346]|uniref:Uncharacterized protein n=1 Tax=Burkholderia pseudomallei 1710a TaxID=320371 RepID=A0A0E1WEA0_BURPE|nr:hypothetical protein GBP346_A2103 [Burkholderia pseudomallei MSHR346]EET07882.1 hypothetical protein BURPS1710A_2528 [Burkholderia pseudomallei 1710a]